MNKHKRNIILTGFMGAGKSTVGALLAGGLDFRLVDLDQLIIARAGRSIRNIFDCDGEEVFRDLETAALKTLDGAADIVVATGGGIVGRPENWQAMRRLGRVVYLQVPWAILSRRIAGDEARPLAVQGDDEGRLRRLWESRLPLYEQADLVVDCRDDAPEKIVQRILLAMEKV